MRVAFKQENGIIKLPDDFAALQTITQTEYLYRFKYAVDIPKALRSKALKAKLTIAMIPKQTKPSVLVGADLVLNIQRRNSTLSGFAKSQKNLQILEKISDITSVVPNDQITALSSGGGAMPSTRVTSLVRVGDLTEQGLEVAVTQQPISRNASLVSPIESSYDLVYRQKLDPASVGTRARTNVTSGNLLAGVYQQLNTSDNNNLLASSQTSLSQNDMVVVQTINTSNYTDVIENIAIPISLVNESEFFLTITLLKNDGTTLETISGSIEHAKLLSVFSVPKLPPKVIISSGDKTVLYVTQKDISAKGVRVYKRILNYNSFAVNALYTFVTDVSLTVEQGETKIVDAGNGNNPVIYRVVSYGKDGVLSSEFSGVVCKSARSHPEPRVAVVASSDPNGIRIEVHSIPSGFIAANIYRQTTSSVNSKTKTLVGTPISLAGLQNDVVSFVDTEVVKNRYYRYTCELLSKTGLKHVAGCVDLQHNPESSDLINTTITNYSVSTSPMNVTFNITSSFAETDESRIKNAIDQLGLSGLFGSDITKEYLQSLVAHKITRINITTGEQEEFGLLTGNTFSDVQEAPSKGVNPLQVGHSYRYVVAAYFRPVTTMLEGYTQTVTNVDTPSLSYTYKPSRWRHPVVGLEGTIGTPTSLAAYHAQNQYTFGTVGKLVTVEASFKETTPNIIKPNAVVLNKELVKLQWSVQGDATKIDHFLISMLCLGHRSVVGKSHNFSDSKQFQFVDVLDSGEKGALTYLVCPVYHDFSRGKEVATNRVLVQ